jgi:hypothetical protein
VLGLLIPGVREVRAPLVAGTLLLVSAYLLLYDSASSVFAERRVSPALQSVYDDLGHTGLLIAGAIVAYLVGTVVTRLVSGRMRLRQAALVPRVAAPAYLAAARKPRLLAFQAPFSRPAVGRIRRLCEQRAIPAEIVLAEIVLSGGKRLLAANRDLYAEYDRMQSEAELRLAVVPPALLLAVAVALQVPAAFAVEVGSLALVAIVAGLVIGDAQALLRNANSMYAHMVADGVVSTPSLDPGSPTPTVAEAD